MISRRHLLHSACSLWSASFVPSARHGPKPLIGYGVVNRWHTVDASRLARTLHNAGCNLTEIEYVAWFDDRGREGKSTRTDIDAAARLVNEMRRHRITTLISVVNWNGEAQRAADDEWYLARLREISLTIGRKDVLLLPVSEPDGQQGGKAYRWAEMARGEWKGRLVGNGDGGRGDPHVPGFEYVDWHHCEDFTVQSVRGLTAGHPTINNTDCGPVLNPGPGRAARMARIAIEKQANFLVYGWKDNTIDGAVIRALGDELQRIRSKQT